MYSTVRGRRGWANGKCCRVHWHTVQKAKSGVGTSHDIVNLVLNNWYLLPFCFFWSFHDRLAIEQFVIGKLANERASAYRITGITHMPPRWTLFTSSVWSGRVPVSMLKTLISGLVEFSTTIPFGGVCRTVPLSRPEHHLQKPIAPRECTISFIKKVPVALTPRWFHEIYMRQLHKTNYLGNHPMNCFKYLSMAFNKFTPIEIQNSQFLTLDWTEFRRRGDDLHYGRHSLVSASIYTVHWVYL